MQGYLWNYPPSDVERCIYIDNDNKVVVGPIRTFKVQLQIGFSLELFETYVAHLFIQNLIFISTWDQFGYSCLFGND